MPSRWSDYYIDYDYKSFWKSRLASEEAKVCVILGVGFDPRSLVALEILAEIAHPSQISYLAMLLPPPPSISDLARETETLTQLNQQRLKDFKGGTRIHQGEVAIRDDVGHPVGARKAVALVNQHLAEIALHRDIVVDISGMPRSFFFPVIKYLCGKSDQGKIRNLHVTVTEDPAIDGKIRGSEYGDADYIQHFRPRGQRRLVWVPIIGKSESNRVNKIHAQLESECIEVCPVIPFPARSLRRADDLLVELREELFERIFVSQDNILLCDEGTPFDVYRKIVEMDEYYRERLKDLPGIGEVTTVVSPLASKMLSLGALLAAIERELPVSYVEAGSYYVETPRVSLLGSERKLNPVEVWLTGEPYEIM